VITVDGVGEWATATIGRAASVNGGHRLEIEGEVDFPHSLGLFYSAFTDFLGFEVNEGEYKVMGMAPYGEPRFVDELAAVLRTYDDGSFWLDLDYFSFHYSARRAWTDKVTQLLGTGPRKRDEPFEPSEERSQRYADIAASVQEVTERAIVNLARAGARAHRLDEPLLRGGVALNAMANRRILEETGSRSSSCPRRPVTPGLRSAPRCTSSTSSSGGGSACRSSTPTGLALLGGGDRRRARGGRGRRVPRVARRGGGARGDRRRARGRRGRRLVPGAASSSARARSATARSSPTRGRLR
jgi:hypothetical protein